MRAMVNTNELRFIAREMPHPVIGSSVGIYKASILQQRWVVVGTMWGVVLDDTNSEWRDVPLVLEAEQPYVSPLTEGERADMKAAWERVDAGR